MTHLVPSVSLGELGMSGEYSGVESQHQPAQPPTQGLWRALFSRSHCILGSGRYQLAYGRDSCPVEWILVTLGAVRNQGLERWCRHCPPFAQSAADQVGSWSLSTSLVRLRKRWKVGTAHGGGGLG